MKIVFPIHNGLDTRWKLVGDYNFIVDIDYNDQRGYRFKWHMTPPADISGLRAVEPEDVAQADKVSLFYPANEANSLVGFASIVRVSDKLYAKLKAGENCEFALDGPDSPLVLRKETMPQAHEIRRDGEETLTIEVDGMKVPVRAIRATTDAGWSYWILDNPNFPIMLKGSGPFQWDELKLAYEGGLLPAPSKAKKPRTRDTTGGETKKANREAENIIKHLKESGEATSYLILFDFDSDKLRPLSKKILDRLCQFLQENPAMRLDVEGHTCNIGGKEYNLNLSRRRAASVRKYMIAHGIGESRLEAHGFGFSRPLASNKTSAGRARNRRVVFKSI